MFRRGVGILLFGPNGCLLAGRKGASLEDSSQLWGLPQGGVDPGESLETTFWRELLEETSLTNEHVVIIGQTSFYTYYAIPDELRVGVFKDVYEGHQHKWFLARVNSGLAACIDRLKSSEFVEMSWMSPARVLASVPCFKQGTYRAVFSYFGIPF